MTGTRQFVVPHVVEFDPQLREAFLTIESYFAEMATGGTAGAGIFWWDGNGNPNSLPLPNARGGDFFIDNLNGDVYRLVATPYSRSAIGTEDETRATDGSMWFDGSGTPVLTQPPQRVQDYYLNVANCDVWALR